MFLVLLVFNGSCYVMLFTGQSRWTFNIWQCWSTLGCLWGQSDAFWRDIPRLQENIAIINTSAAFWSERTIISYLWPKPLLLCRDHMFDVKFRNQILKNVLKQIVIFYSYLLLFTLSKLDKTFSRFDELYFINFILTNQWNKSVITTICESRVKEQNNHHQSTYISNVIARLWVANGRIKLQTYRNNDTTVHPTQCTYLNQVKIEYMNFY